MTVQAEHAPRTGTMDDIRDYLDVLIRRWTWIVGMAVLGILGAAAASYTVKPIYQASAVIALAPSTLAVPISNQAQPYYLIVDSPSHLPIAHTPAYYVALLKGDDVVRSVSSSLPVEITFDSGDKSLIGITVRGEDPKQAAAAANQWAQAGAARIQQVLVPSGEETAAAQKKLDAAEQALGKFSQENGLGDYDLTKLRTNTSLPMDKKLALAQLIRDRDVAESVYVDLARDLERETILAAGSFKPTVIAAAPATAPIAPKPVQSMGIGAALGLLVGLLSAFAVEFVSRRPAG